MTLLSLDAVSKEFHGIKAVDRVSFDIDRGQVVGFLGPNGAGKSTTMRIITQFYDPDHGEIRLDGVVLGDDSLAAKRRIGYLPENNPLYTEMLVTDYLAFVARLREIEGQEATRAIDDAVGATGIEAVYYRPIGELSKGFRQRVGLAQAILHRPDLLVLDEPTEGLDPSQRLEIRRLIGHLGQDRTVLLSTHVLSEVRDTCSRLLIINKGAIAADGSVEELAEQAGGAVQVLVEIEGEQVEEGIGELEGVRDVVRRQSAGDGRTALMVTAKVGRDLRPEIFGLARDRGWTLYELHQEARSLEDLFLQVTEDAPDGTPAETSQDEGGAQ
jgi:ABC-2 type transport system ATP-binding protein